MKSQDIEKEIERLTKALKSPHITNTTNPIDFPKSRIEQLADECWTHTKQPLFSSKSPHWEFDRYKFAELIVRECINEIHVADVGDLKAKGYYLDKVAEHIERHFGVEE